MSFVKIYASILDSSVWGESPATVKVWIALLAMADKNGFVETSFSGLTRRAAVSATECAEAVRVLEAPDPDSKNPDNEGRRIEKVDRGWVVLNHTYYRDLRTEEQVAVAARVARWRERQKGTPADSNVTDVTGNNSNSDIPVDAEVEAEADRDSDTETSTSTTETPEQIDVRLKQVLSAIGFQGATAGWADSWSKMLLGMRGGLGTPRMQAVSWDVLLEAAQELAIEVQRAGGDVTPSRYKAFVGKVLNRRDRAADAPATQYGAEAKKRKGYTLLASKLIQKVRALRNPQFPSSLVPDWRAKLDAEPLGDGKLGQFVDDFGISRFLAKVQDDGTLTAQLARAMEEAGL